MNNSDAGIVESEVFYKHDVDNVSFLNAYRIIGWRALCCYLNKLWYYNVVLNKEISSALKNYPYAFNIGVRRIERAPFLIELHTKLLKEANTHGFFLQFMYAIPLLGAHRAFHSVFLDSDHTRLLILIMSKERYREKSELNIDSTHWATETRIQTINGVSVCREPQDVGHPEPPQEGVVSYLGNAASLDNVLKAHQRLIRIHGWRGIQPWTPNELVDFINKQDRRQLDYQTAIGLCVKLPDTQIEDLRNKYPDSIFQDGA